MKYLKWAERILQIACCVLLMFCVTFKLKWFYVAEIIVVIMTTLLTTARNYQTVKNTNKTMEEPSVPRLLERKDFISSDAWLRYKREYHWCETFCQAAQAKNNLLKKHNCHIESQYRWFETLFLCAVLAIAAFNT